MSKIESMSIKSLPLDKLPTEATCGLVFRIKLDTENKPRRSGVVFTKTAEPKELAKYIMGFARMIDIMVDDERRDEVIATEGEINERKH